MHCLELQLQNTHYIEYTRTLLNMLSTHSYVDIKLIGIQAIFLVCPWIKCSFLEKIFLFVLDLNVSLMIFVSMDLIEHQPVCMCVVDT